MFTMFSSRNELKMNKKYYFILLFFTTGIFCLVLYITYRNIIPRNIGGKDQIRLYLSYSRNVGDFISPDDRIKISIIINDAGAMHSGYHWTWVVRNNWWGKEIVATGWLRPIDFIDKKPIRWIDNNNLKIFFVNGRHSNIAKITEISFK